MSLCCTCKDQPKAGGQSRCRDCYNTYMREYNARRYAERRRHAIDYLGGTCAWCGSEKDLEFDHLVRTNKSAPISKLIMAQDEKLYRELDKCQLLCNHCHKYKTSSDTYDHGEGAWGKKGCVCEPCRKARRGSMAAWRAAMGVGT